MSKRFEVLAKTSPRFSRHEPRKNLILVFLEKDRKRRFNVPTHTAIGKACMKVLKERVESGLLGNAPGEKPPIPAGFTETDVAGINEKRFCMLPEALKPYKAKLIMWNKKNNALDRAKDIIARNDIAEAMDFVEDRGDMPFERYKFQILEEVE